MNSLAISSQGSPRVVCGCLDRKSHVDVAVAVDNDESNSIFMFSVPNDVNGASQRRTLSMPAPVNCIATLPESEDYRDTSTYVAGMETGEVRVFRNDDEDFELLPFKADVKSPVLSLTSTNSGLYGSTADGDVFCLDFNEDFRLKERSRNKVGGFGGLPLMKMIPAVTDTNCALGIVQGTHTIAMVDFRCAPSGAIQCWRHEPLDPLNTLCTSGSNVIAGSEAGKAVIWDIRSPKVMATTKPIGGRFTGMSAVDDATFMSVTSNGLMHRWDRSHTGPATSDGFLFTSKPEPFRPDPLVEGVNAPIVDLWCCAQLNAAIALDGVVNLLVR